MAIDTQNREYDILNSYDYKHNSYKFLNLYEFKLISVISGYNPCYVEIDILALESSMSRRKCIMCIDGLVQKKIITKERYPIINGKKLKTDLLIIDREKIKILLKQCDNPCTPCMDEEKQCDNPCTPCMGIGAPHAQVPVHTVHLSPYKVLNTKVLNSKVLVEIESSDSPNIPKQVLELWNKIVKEKGHLAGVRTDNNEIRTRHILKSTKLYLQTIEAWKTYFYSFYQSKHLLGQRKKTGSKYDNWKAKYSWAIDPNNVIKVIDGDYYDKRIELVEEESDEELEIRRRIRESRLKGGLK